MLYVSEQMVRDLVRQADVTAAVSEAFVALADEKAVCWPIVRETLGHADAVFGFKSGFDKSLPAMGVKAGGLWPGNAARGVPNHQSTVVLFDEDSGAPKALVRATYLTALRTAAASALSIRHLARADARVLGLMGAGGQGAFQLEAALAERRFTKVLIHDPNAANVEALADYARAKGVSAATGDPRYVVAEADVLITVTPSRQAIVKEAWVRPGTHIAAMGADTVGKQELEAGILASATLFGDVAGQAVRLGESQHAFGQGLIGEETVRCLGDVISKRHPGRTDDKEITVFDSTGMALQDLSSCMVALKAAVDAGQAIELP
ncbi:ornithine cyclodeaminase family protein [Eilatimonas milleporae]|uniref:Ornithine cyclodeaminase n=1 Tax=Eilatimonas milleporae TaxID=911205 RepID=A0A3M0CE00_9PROT|nr:ornithine cyclodeaminase family protein [Eilatimonas milleporae]RMB04966.1 ornithine cyclodeaminase [Eilatimonas milleporae]